MSNAKDNFTPVATYPYPGRASICKRAKKTMMSRRTFAKTAGATALATGLPLGQATADQGFWVPGEEQIHEATLMQWPASPLVYEDAEFLIQTQGTIAQIANAIADFEPVILLADRSEHALIRRHVGMNVEVWDIPTEDLWCRDAGPIFVRDVQGNRAVRGIEFNGWGQRQVHVKDAAIARRVAQALDFPFLPTNLKGEAGGVEQDGFGLLIAHESSWLNDNRNPGLSRDEIGAALLEAYGAGDIIWSPGVYDLDITDYHIDALARFTGPGKVLANLKARRDLRDPFDTAARQTVAGLQAAGLDVSVILEPTQPRVRDGEFVSSYANFYVCNGAVIAAEFGDGEADTAAVRALQAAYPDRQVLTMNVDTLGALGGGIHCATQQLIT